MKPMMLKLRHTGSPSSAGGVGAIWETDVSYTISTTHDQTMFAPEGNGYVVRRLTPTECERLQAFPDGYTDLTGCDVDAVTDAVAASLHYGDEEKEKLRRKVRRWSEECPDGPRYKALGNSMTTTVMRWLGERVELVEEEIERQEGDRQ